MADFVSKDKRSKIMRGVKQKDTRPEIRARKMLHSLGYRFRLHPKDLPGRPDIVLPRHQTVIMVHGCFWHQHRECPEGRLPTSNTNYWTQKMKRNIERDAETKTALKKLGWKVGTVWECETKNPVILRSALLKIFPS